MKQWERELEIVRRRANDLLLILAGMGTETRQKIVEHVRKDEHSGNLYSRTGYDLQGVRIALNNMFQGIG